MGKRRKSKRKSRRKRRSRKFSADQGFALFTNAELSRELDYCRQELDDCRHANAELSQELDYCRHANNQLKLANNQLDGLRRYYENKEVNAQMNMTN